MRFRKGTASYHDLSQPDWSVMVPSSSGCSEADQLRCSAHLGSAEREAWPNCIESGITVQGAGSAGIFVNLLSFGITTGCFRDDCQYSDHFSCGSPATCAQTCAGIRACKWWTFWPTHSGGTCWLRRHDQHRALMAQSLTANTECQPSSRGGVDGGKGSEPTIFELARGQWGVSPNHPFHQWDLVKVLEAFGHSTPSQIQAQEATALQRSALRFARRAQAGLCGQRIG